MTRAPSSRVAPLARHTRGARGGGRRIQQFPRAGALADLLLAIAATIIAGFVIAGAMVWWSARPWRDD